MAAAGLCRPIVLGAFALSLATALALFRKKRRVPVSRYAVRMVQSEDLEELVRVANWAYRGKPNSAKQGWTCEDHIVAGLRIDEKVLMPPHLIDCLPPGAGNV